MKKARKKRIVRRKRRISEREIMRIKRKLKKSARKLRLGAKRTGAYVYGTLRRIVGNPAIPAHMGNPDFVREFRVAEMRARLSGEPVGLYAYQTKSGWNFITRKQSMYRPPGEELVVLFGEKRGLRGNPLSYYVGGLSSLGAKRESQRRMRTYNQIKKSIQRGNASYGELAVLQSLAKEHPKLFAGDPMMAEAGGISEAQFRRLRGNPYPTGGMAPLERLRYHVSGAIARGEATPIVGKPRRRIVRVLGYDVVEGSKKHMRLLEQKRHFDDLQRSERGLRGNPFEPDKIMKLRRILADRQYAKIDGQVVDGVTARAILMVYDGLNEKNRARYSAMPIVKMANIAWKLVR